MELNSSTRGLKILCIEIVIIGIIICLVLVVLNYLGVISFSFFPSSQFSHKNISQSSTLFTPTDSPAQSGTLPLPLDNPNVESIAYLYRLKGTIETVETVNNNTVITLKQTDSAIPPLNILNNTSVLIQDTQGNTQKATREDIKANQQISLSAVFDPPSNKWSGYGIRIFESSP